MDRVFLPPADFQEGRVVVSGPERHHLADVLRAQKGDRFLATDGEGREALLETESVTRGELVARIVEETIREPGPGRVLTLAISPPKGGRMEIAVEKTVECGVGRIVPVLAARSVVKTREDSSRVDRWRRVARAAVAQSGLVHLPEIAAVTTFRDALAAACAETVLVAHPGLTAKSVTAAFEEAGGGRATMFIGPEGGFTDEELEWAARCGAIHVSLGPTRLRTETAAIVAVSFALASLSAQPGS